MEQKFNLYFIGIIAGIILLSQILLPVYAADREKMEEVTKKIQAQLDQLKSNMNNDKIAWNATKTSTDNARNVYQQNPTPENLNLLNNAKEQEAKSYQKYLNSLKLVREFKPDLEQKVIEKAEKNDDVSKSSIILEKISVEADKVANDLVKALDKWGDSKKKAREAKLLYLRDSTQANLNLMNQAMQQEKTDELSYLKALNATKKISANPQATQLISNKQLSDSISDKRIGSDSQSDKIQQEYNALRKNLNDIDNTWTLSKKSTDDAKAAYQQNPTQKSLNLLNDAKQKEAENYQNYLKTLKEVREFKPDLDERL